MLDQSKQAYDDSMELLGDWHPLLQQLGSTEGLVTLHGVADALRLPRVDSIKRLVRFVETYRDQVLCRLDLPVIHRAHQHAAANELRELLELDRTVGAELLPPPFLAASRRVGQASLRRLRPLRDQRLVQRYLRAMEAGRATGWHTLVYGLTLAIYSLPVRQGLLHYASQTLAGFLHSAARPLKLTERERRTLLEEVCAELPEILERTLSKPALG